MNSQQKPTKLTVSEHDKRWITVIVPDGFSPYPPGTYKIENRFDDPLELFDVPLTERRLIGIDATPDANFPINAYGDFEITIQGLYRIGGLMQMALESAYLLPLDQDVPHQPKLY